MKRNPEDLTADPVAGPPIHIDVEIVAEMLKASEGVW